jgi:hypothetical protein
VAPPPGAAVPITQERRRMIEEALILCRRSECAEAVRLLASQAKADKT